MELGDNCRLLDALVDVARCEVLPDGLYRALRRALTFDVNWLLSTSQSTISGYVYPNFRVVQAVAEVHRRPELSEWNGDSAGTVSHLTNLHRMPKRQTDVY